MPSRLGAELFESLSIARSIPWYEIFKSSMTDSRVVKLRSDGMGFSSVNTEPKKSFSSVATRDGERSTPSLEMDTWDDEEGLGLITFQNFLVFSLKSVVISLLKNLSLAASISTLHCLDCSR